MQKPPPRNTSLYLCAGTKYWSNGPNVMDLINAWRKSDDDSEYLVITQIGAPKPRTYHAWCGPAGHNPNQAFTGELVAIVTREKKPQPPERRTGYAPRNGGP